MSIEVLSKTVNPPENAGRSYPPGLFILSVSELLERFSYYGMRALLMLFFVSEMRYSDTRAFGVYSLYAAMAYAAPLVGGYLADKVIGFKRAILVGSFIIAAGNILMAIPSNEKLSYIGLGLMISGTGLFKSNLAALVGKLYDRDDERKEAGYSLFYVCINVGGFLAPLLCGYIGQTYGWHYGFAITALGMIVCGFILLYYQNDFQENDTSEKKITPERRRSLNRLTVVGGVAISPFFSLIIYHYDLFSNLLPFVGLCFVIYLLRISMTLSRQERRDLWGLIIGIGLLMLSGALIEQSGMALTLFFERNVDRQLLGYLIPTSFFQSVDPLTALVFGGFFTFVWGRFRTFRSKNLIYFRYALGFLFISLCYVVIQLGCARAMETGAGIVSLAYAGVGLLLLSLADVCIYPLTLYLCSKLSPRRFEGVMMGGVMVGVSLSYLIGGSISRLASIDQAALQTMNALKSIEIYCQFFQKLSYLGMGGVVIATGFSFVIIKLLRKEEKSDMGPQTPPMTTKEKQKDLPLFEKDSSLKAS